MPGDVDAPRQPDLVLRLDVIDEAGKRAVWAECLPSVADLSLQHAGIVCIFAQFWVVMGVVVRNFVIAFVALVLGTPAFAAGGLPMAAGYNWGGLYVGGNVGYGWGANSNPTSSYVDGNSIGLNFYFPAANSMLNVNPSGMIGGGQLGYNWMLAPNWLAGLATDIQASGVQGSTSVAMPVSGHGTGYYTNSLSTEWFGTVRARAGMTHDNWLVYATGGLAYGQVKASGLYSFYSGTPLFSGSATQTKVGWTLGGGIEYGVTPNWTVGAEYLYVDLGKISYTELDLADFPASSITVSNHAALNVFRLTANYKF